ncbi:MAG TPA: glycosyltransferase family 9 protein [Candidatus Saccharimonadales bacterium]|nr:glycosyltransferase family 9 protein [Candidatus Saccharimonadales bacterium]
MTKGQDFKSDGQKNILLIRLKSIGDVILTLPAVHAMRENFPYAKITFLTSEENAALMGGFREVNQVITLDRAVLRSGNPMKMAGEFFKLLRRLRAGKFSLVVDLQGYGETAWLTRLTGASQRWASTNRSGRAWAYTRSIKPIPMVHPAEAHLELLRKCGLKVGDTRNKFVLPEAAVSDAQAWLTENRLNTAKPIIYIQPFTSGAHKNWPLENYLAVARYWYSRNVQIIFGGGPSDRAALELARQKGFTVSAGVPLLVTGGLMQLSTLVLGGDTGALHLAVAQGKRVLMLLHQDTPGSPVPFQHPEWVVVAPTPLAIAKIPVADVLAATERAFTESAGNVSC